MNGLSIPAWSGRRRVDALIWVKAEGQRKNTPCCICEQSIDYSLEYPHEQSCSVQHVKPRSAFPHLTWERSNWKPAHLSCNKAEGVGTIHSLGVTSEEW